jgi:hypothetical protein
MDIWCAIKAAWPAIESALKIVPGLVLLPLTFFLGWKKIGNKVQASFSWQHERISANRLTNLVITNLKDKPITVHEIHILIDRHIVVPVQRLSPPQVIKGLESVVIEPDRVSHYNLGDEEYEPEWRPGQMIEMFLTTQHGPIQCEIVNTPSIESYKKFKDYALAVTHTRKYNDIVINDEAAYALIYKYDGEVKTAILERSGFITVNWRFLPNALRKEDLATAQTVKAALMSSDIKYHIKESELLVDKLS